MLARRLWAGGPGQPVLSLESLLQGHRSLRSAGTALSFRSVMHVFLKLLRGPGVSLPFVQIGSSFHTALFFIIKPVLSERIFFCLRQHICVNVRHLALTVNALSFFVCLLLVFVVVGFFFFGGGGGGGGEGAPISAVKQVFLLISAAESKLELFDWTVIAFTLLVIIDLSGAGNMFENERDWDGAMGKENARDWERAMAAKCFDRASLKVFLTGPLSVSQSHCQGLSLWS